MPKGGYVDRTLTHIKESGAKNPYAVAVGKGLVRREGKHLVKGPKAKGK